MDASNPRTLREDETWYCLDCDRFLLDHNSEYYMVKDAIWYGVTSAKNAKACCASVALKGALVGSW